MDLELSTTTSTSTAVTAWRGTSTVTSHGTGKPGSVVSTSIESAAVSCPASVPESPPVSVSTSP